MIRNMKDHENLREIENQTKLKPLYLVFDLEPQQYQNWQSTNIIKVCIDSKGDILVLAPQSEYLKDTV